MAKLQSMCPKKDIEEKSSSGKRQFLLSFFGLRPENFEILENKLSMDMSKLQSTFPKEQFEESLLFVEKSNFFGF